MDAVRVLDEIERIGGTIVNFPQCERTERVHAYTDLRVLIQELEEMAALSCDTKEIDEKLKKLEWSCRAITGLDQGGGPTEAQHFAKIRETIKELHNHYGETKTRA